MTRPTILDSENVALLDLTSSGRAKPAWAAAAEKVVAQQMASLTASVMRHAGDDDTTAWDDVRKAYDALEEKVAFTMSDTSRMLRKSDVKDVCPHPDDCFYETDRVRCGPCAVKASKLEGIEIDDTHSHLPEVCRLRREVKAAEARIAELEAALDEKEVASGLTSNGNLWRFWSTKASALAARNAELEKRLADAERVMEPFSELLSWFKTRRRKYVYVSSNADGTNSAQVSLAHFRAARAYMEGK